MRMFQARSVRITCHRREDAAQFFGDDAQFERTKAQSAIVSGNGGTEPAHSGDVLPQRPVETRIAFEHAAHNTRRAFLGEKLPRLFAQQLLFVGKIEVHRRSFRTSPAITIGRAGRKRQSGRASLTAA